MADIDLGKAYIQIAPSTRGLAAGVQKAFGGVARASSDAGRKSGRSFGGGFSAIASGIGVGLGMKLVDGVGGAIKKIGSMTIGKGISRALQIEEAKKKLEGLGHQTGEVEAIMKNATAAVKGTAFGLGEAATVAASTVAAGVKPGKELERTLKLMGDAATIAGTDMQTMGSIVNKVATSDMMQMDVANQLMDAGIPIIQLVAKEMGVTAEEARKLASKGKVNFETFQKALEKGLGGAALKSGETFRGAMANVGAALGRIGADFAAPALDAIRDLGNAGIPVIDEVGKTLKPVSEQFGAWVKSIMPGMLNAVGRVPGAIASASDALSGLAKSTFVTEFVGGLHTFAASWHDFDGEITSAGFPGWMEQVAFNLRSVWEGLKDAVAGFIDGFGGLDTLFGVFKNLLPLVTGPLGLIRAALADVFAPGAIDFGALGQAFGQHLAPILTSISGLIGRVGGAIGRIVAGVLPTLKAGFERVQPSISALVQAFSPFVDAIGRVIDFITPILIPALQFLAAILMDALKGAIDGVTWVLRGLTDVLNGVIDFIVNIFSGNWSAAWEGIKTALWGVIQSIAGAIWTWMNVTVVNAVRGGIMKVAGFFTSGWAGIKGIFTGALNALKTSVGSAWNVVKGTTGTVWNAIKSVISTVWGGIRGVVSGAINGVKSTISTVMNAIKGNWDAVWSGIKGIGSRAWGWIRDTANGVFEGMIGTVGGAFERIKGAVDVAWNGIKSVVAKPINVVIGFINTGIIGAYNWVADKLKMSKLSTIQKLPGYARGGILPGSSSWRDGDDQLIMARAGEGVTVSEALRDPYERRRLLALNEAARKGVSPERFRQMFDAHPQGFARGGIVSWKGKSFTAVFAAALQAAERAAGHSFRVTQGGFRPRTSYSGTSHQGDAVDIARPFSRATVAALRKHGIAAWDRTGKGNWIPHIHGVPLPGFGSPAGSAVWQAQDYLRGGDGLGGRDNGPRGNAISEGLKGLIEAVKAGFDSVWGWFKEKFNDFVGPLKNLALPRGNLIGGLAKGIAEKLKSDVWEWAKSKIGFAGGTTSAPAGWAWVGERGPELVRFRGGEQVLSNRDSMRAIGGTHVTQHNTIRLPEWVKDLDDVLAFLRGPELAYHLG